MAGSRHVELLDVLAELARSGQLGPVANGGAWGVVTEALGEPFEVVVAKRRSWPRLFAYGDLELSVCRCQKIILLCLQTWRDTVELPAGLVEKRSFPGHPKYAEVAAAALLLLLVLTTVLALGAAYVPRPAHRTAARHTLHLLLRLAPWYPDAGGERARGERGVRGSRH